MAVLFVHKSRCFYCMDVAEHVDHITPVCDGGINALENLIAACRSCNQRKNRWTLDDVLLEQATTCAVSKVDDLRAAIAAGSAPPNAPTFINIQVEDDFLSDVDDWRRAQPNMPSRSEAIRQMVKAARRGLK